MSSFVAFLVFLLVMMALACLAIILDWMGKPVRRAFRPRTSGTPRWLESGSPPPQPEPAPAEHVAEPAGSIQSKVPELSKAGAVSHSSSPTPALRPSTRQAWQAGDSIYKLTTKGTPPSLRTVRRRYWKNLSERRASIVMGTANQALMAIGQAPQRYNPRTGATEKLALPEPMLRERWKANRAPTPTWGDEGVDPFAQP